MNLQVLAVISISVLILALGVLAGLARAQGFPGNQPPAVKGPWMDQSLSPDRRAE